MSSGNYMFTLNPQYIHDTALRSRYKEPRIRARRAKHFGEYRKFEKMCECSNFLADDIMVQLVYGRVVNCPNCGHEVWLDLMSNVYDGDYSKIFYNGVTSWAIIKTENLQYYVQLGIKYPELLGENVNVQPKEYDKKPHRGAASVHGALRRSWEKNPNLSPV